MFDEGGRRVEISELRSVHLREAESGGEIRYALFAEAGVIFLRGEDERRRKPNGRWGERGREKERDKGNTGFGIYAISFIIYEHFPQTFSTNIFLTLETDFSGFIVLTIFYLIRFPLSAQITMHNLDRKFKKRSFDQP